MSKGEEIRIYASDDLVTRARNITHILGYRGAVGNYVLEVHNILREYESLDKQAASEACPECNGTGWRESYGCEKVY